jgi:hypothetical protein
MNFKKKISSSLILQQSIENDIRLKLNNIYKTHNNKLINLLDIHFNLSIPSSWFNHNFI